MHLSRIAGGLIFLWLFCWPALAAPPQITAASAVVIEGTTGQVLYAKNADEPRPPASTTKIVTALLALQLGVPGEVVTASPRAAAIGEASIFLHPYEELTLEEMIKGALIKSGNDAALALAEHVAGSQEMFTWLMNREARLVGAQGSNFVNPHGLPAPSHRATAHDLALFARYALTNPIFAATVRTRETTISWPGYSWPRYLRNTNRLLWSYPGATGVKTGTTQEAGPCLVAAAARQERQLIAVVLNSGDRYGDAARLLDYGFQAYRLVTYPPGAWRAEVRVRGGVAHTVPVANAEVVAVSIPREQAKAVGEVVELPPEVTAPVQAGEPVGRVELMLGGRQLATASLVTTVPVAKAGWSYWLKFAHEGGN